MPEEWQSLAVLVLAWLLDARFGEPPAKIHPVVWMGRAIAPLKRVVLQSHAAELAVGGLYAALVIVGFTGIAFATLYLSRALPLLQLAIATYWLWCSFALRGLVRAGSVLREGLERNDLAAARRALGSLCSRDARELSPVELAGAGIESLTENTSDSVIAPLCFFVLFGVPGAVFYRVANTLDAMVGYRGRYEWVGKVAARLDDLLNLVPARLTALLLALAGWVLSKNLINGLRVWWRDAGCTQSPNAGQPMAMAAGLLGVRLDKRDAYVLGADLKAPDVLALHGAEQLVRVTGFLAFLATVLVITALGGKHVFTIR